MACGGQALISRSSADSSINWAYWSGFGACGDYSDRLRTDRTQRYVRLPSKRCPTVQMCGEQQFQIGSCCGGTMNPVMKRDDRHCLRRDARRRQSEDSSEPSQIGRNAMQCCPNAVTAAALAQANKTTQRNIRLVVALTAACTASVHHRQHYEPTSQQPLSQPNDQARLDLNFCATVGRSVNRFQLRL